MVVWWLGKLCYQGGLTEEIRSMSSKLIERIGTNEKDSGLPRTFSLKSPYTLERPAELLVVVRERGFNEHATKIIETD